MSPWTTKLDDKLRTLWAAGKTGGQIEALMPGFTRSAVLAHARSLDLPRRGPDSPKKGVRREPKAIRKAKVARMKDWQPNKSPTGGHRSGDLKPVSVSAGRKTGPSERAPSTLGAGAVQDRSESTAPPIPTAATNVSLLGLGHGMCRYPIGPLMEKATLFCGGPAEEGCSWCGAHRLRVFVPRETRRKPAPGYTPKPIFEEA